MKVLELATMADVLFHQVVEDLTVGRPQMQEFSENASVAEAIAAISGSTHGEIPVWKPKPRGAEATETEFVECWQERFVGTLNTLDIVSHLSTKRSLADPEAALRASVCQIVVHNKRLLRQVDPSTRLIDALEMMEQGVRWLLVRRTSSFSGIRERFSGLKFLAEDFCCISREDVMRFLIEILGRLAPVPLMDIRSLGAVTERVCVVDNRQPARDAVSVLRQNDDIQAVAVVETVRECDGTFRVVGEICSFRLRKCDYLRKAWALGNLTAGEFVSLSENCNALNAVISFGRRKEEKMKRFGGGFSKDFGKNYSGILKSRNMKARLFNKGENALLTCTPTNCLAAVMAQMLSHGATHVWVSTEGEVNGKLVGIVTYLDIFRAVTKPPNSLSG